MKGQVVAGSGSFPKDSTGADVRRQGQKEGDLCSGSMKQWRHRYGEEAEKDEGAGWGW
jgi:hypothetical protein